MKKLILIFLICMLFLLACTHHSNDLVSEEGQSISVLTIDEQKQLVDDLLEQWSITYELTALQAMFAGETQRWLEPTEQIDFWIKDFSLDAEDYKGVYRKEQDWDITGSLPDGQSFLLKRNKEQLQLSYDQSKQELPKEEFDLLLPIQHLQLIQTMLTEQMYEELSFSKTKHGWQLVLYSSLHPVQQTFEHYVTGHRQLGNKQETKLQLENYRLTYELQIEEQVDNWKLTDLQFVLENKEQVLEKVLFTLNKGR